MRTNPLSPRWLDRYELLLSSGRPFSKNETPHSVILIREDDKRPPDPVSLAAILDTCMPRVFFVTDQARAACLVDRIASDTGLTTACSACYAEALVCTLYGEDPELCIPDFEGCAGVAVE